MADRRPPTLCGDERDTLLVALAFQRDSFLAKYDGLATADAERVMVPSGTTLLWLLEHVAYAEGGWIVKRSGGEAVPPESATKDPLTRALAHYRATCAQVDAVVAEHSLDDPWRGYGEATDVNLRWVLTHLLEEIARHAGHADILRELIDGTTGR